jgi:hypothetical protein
MAPAGTAPGLRCCHDELLQYTSQVRIAGYDEQHLDTTFAD